MIEHARRRPLRTQRPATADAEKLAAETEKSDAIRFETRDGARTRRILHTYILDFDFTLEAVALQNSNLQNEGQFFVLNL